MAAVHSPKLSSLSECAETEYTTLLGSRFGCPVCVPMLPGAGRKLLAYSFLFNYLQPIIRLWSHVNLLGVYRALSL